MRMFDRYRRDEPFLSEAAAAEVAKILVLPAKASPPPATPTRGYRAWSLVWEDEGSFVLSSLNQYMRWDSPEMTAHEVPDPANKSGIYSCATVFHMYNKASGDVIGEVDLLGHVQPHDNGVIRSERARIRSLKYVGNKVQLSLRLPVPDSKNRPHIAGSEEIDRLLRKAVLMNTPMSMRMLPGKYVVTGQGQLARLIIPLDNAAVTLTVTREGHGDEQVSYEMPDLPDLVMYERHDGLMGWGESRVLTPQEITRMLCEKYEVPEFKEDEP